MPPRSPFTWSASASRYRNSRGQFVSRADVRKAIDVALESQQRRIRTLSNELRGERITIQWWQREMRSALKSTHIYSAAAARGGFGQMGSAEYGQVGQRLREQYRFLDRFAKEIETGLPLDGRFMSRTELYAQSGRATFHEHDSKVQADSGMEFERSLLAASDHCDTCVQEASKDWVLIGQLIPIGMRDCLGHCLCTMEYR